eukprot:ctg_3704.g641
MGDSGRSCAGRRFERFVARRHAVVVVVVSVCAVDEFRAAECVPVRGVDTGDPVCARAAGVGTAHRRVGGAGDAASAAGATARCRRRPRRC